MKINEVEALVGITKKNTRFYEEQGLLELGMIVPVWILLKTRLKEIEGGEEDEATQY